MNLHFITNVQLKNIIGKDLINNDNIAILELVKNAFDANAKRTDISFVNLKNNDDLSIEKYSSRTSRLIIRDNGVGMDINDIKNKWLNIAYSEKKKKSYQHNRMMAGAKGVGRFSCDRLGEFLNLYTKKEESSEFILLQLNWRQFEVDDEKKEIQDVVLEYEILSTTELEMRGIKPFKHGVVLEIIKLRSQWVYWEQPKWNTEKLVNLRTYLERLINPNQAFEKNDFGIYLNAPEFEEENKNTEEKAKFIGRIENSVFEKLNFKATSIECEVQDNGATTLTTLKDKGETIFWIKEKNEFSDFIKDAKCIIFYLNPYSKAFFTKQTGIRPVNYGSIYLFLNGFRIPPYGEEGDDWLGLEFRKQQGYARFLGTRDIVGRIEVLDRDDYFRIVSSREGLVENECYKKLTNGFFNKTLKRLEKYVVDGLAWDSIPKDLNISDIEKKIISGAISENDLQYREDEITKKRRTYSSIHSIIAAKATDVIELYVNEELILNKIQEEKINSEREFEQLLSDFESKKIDGDALNRILQKKALENEDLQRQIKELSKYSTVDATTKAIAELQYYKSIVEKQTATILELQKRLREIDEQHRSEVYNLQQHLSSAIDEKFKEAQKRKEAEEYADKIKIEKEKEVQIERLKVEFYKKQSTPETDALIHHVKNNNSKIKQEINNLMANLNMMPIEKTYKNKLLESLFVILRLSNKSLKATDLILESDLSEADIQKINLPSFISGYLSTIDTKLKVHYKTKIEYFMVFGSKLDLALIIDNFLDNSEAWKAKNIWFSCYLQNDNMILNIYDDGEGLSQEFSNNPNEIFQFRKTGKNNGTGFGLYLVQESLRKMNATIIVDSPVNKTGMNFKIIFK